MMRLSMASHESKAEATAFNTTSLDYEQLLETTQIILMLLENYRFGWKAD